MEFKINEYAGKFVMHIPDRNSADVFSEYLNSNGRVWCNGNSYVTANDYTEHYPCYMFNEGMRCAVGHAKRNDYTILNFNDFSWEHLDLEPSDEEISAQNAFLASFIR